MQQQISVSTLSVGDLARSKRFYMDVQLLQFPGAAVNIGRVAAGAVNVFYQKNIKSSSIRCRQHLEQSLASHRSGAAIQNDVRAYAKDSRLMRFQMTVGS